jgi:hypothetical protein
VTFLRKQRQDSEALLFGVAGFLDAPDLDGVRKSTRTYLRLLWDRWWKYREQFSRRFCHARFGKRVAPVHSIIRIGGWVRSPLWCWNGKQLYLSHAVARQQR